MSFVNTRQEASSLMGFLTVPRFFVHVKNENDSNTITLALELTLYLHLYTFDIIPASRYFCRFCVSELQSLLKKFNLLASIALQVPESLGLWVALWCGDGGYGVNCDSHIRLRNVSGPLGSVGLARLWGGSHTKDTQSHSSGASGQAWWLPATWQWSLVFAWERFPDSLVQGSTVAQAEHCFWLRGKARS